MCSILKWTRCRYATFTLHKKIEFHYCHLNDPDMDIIDIVVVVRFLLVAVIHVEVEALQKVKAYERERKNHFPQGWKVLPAFSLFRNHRRSFGNFHPTLRNNLLFRLLACERFPKLMAV